MNRNIKRFIGVIVFLMILICPVVVRAEEDPCSFFGAELTEISCSTVFTPDSLSLIKEILGYIQLLVPLVLVVLISLDFAKAVISHNQDELKKASSTVITRIMAGICVFLVPTIVNVFLGLPGLESLNSSEDPLCMNEDGTQKASLSLINATKKLEEFNLNDVPMLANDAISNTSKCVYSRPNGIGYVGPSKGNTNNGSTAPQGMAPNSKKCDGTTHYGSKHTADEYCGYAGNKTGGVTMLACAATEIEKAFSIINQYCGPISHAGTMRSLSTSAAGSEHRSSTSLHYTGRAIDFNTQWGMSSGTTYFYVTLDNTSGKNNANYYRLYCKASQSNEASAYVQNKTITPVYGRSMTKKQPVTDRFLDVTAVMNAYGFNGVGPRSCYKTNTMCLEWWHFQNTTGLTNKSTFKSTLEQYYSKGTNYPDHIRANFNCRFSGLGFSC